MFSDFAARDEAVAARERVRLREEVRIVVCGRVARSCEQLTENGDRAAPVVDSMCAGRNVPLDGRNDRGEERGVPGIVGRVAVEFVASALLVGAGPTGRIEEDERAARAPEPNPVAAGGEGAGAGGAEGTGG